jgi:transcriptional regulator with XRE-family HTH domain
MEEKESNVDAAHSLPDLKERIVAVLNARNLTYKQLVDYIGVTEEALDHALEQNTIEIRTLELISKELRIPLYSFFRDPNAQSLSDEHPFYNVNIWAPEEIHLRTENETLRQEIERLRMEIAKKELFIQGLESQLKGKP